MGRSVETYGDVNIYLHDYFDSDDDDGFLSELLWDDLIYDIQLNLGYRFPSFYESDRWAGYPYRETRIISENELLEISISEYCGLIAIGIKMKENYPNLEKRMLPLVESFVTEKWGTCIQVGRFSNGNAIYQTITKEE